MKETLIGLLIVVILIIILSILVGFGIEFGQLIAWHIWDFFGLGLG